MSYLGWCYTKPKLDAASPPEYSGPRARAQLGSLYNALIYRQAEEERSAVELSSGLIVELVRFHHRYDTHGRAMTGCLLLLFSVNTSPETREATLQEMRALIFSEDSTPELTDAVRSYEASLDEVSADSRSYQSPLLSSSSPVKVKSFLLIGLAALLVLMSAWSLIRSSKVSSIGVPSSVDDATSGDTAKQSVADTVATDVSTGTSTGTSVTRDSIHSSRASNLQRLKQRAQDTSQPKGSGRPIQVHQVTTIEECIAAYQRAAPERAAWSAWTRASLSRRCQALAVRAARGDLRALESLPDSPQTQALCQRRLIQLQKLARHQDLTRDSTLNLLETRCAEMHSLKD